MKIIFISALITLFFPSFFFIKTVKAQSVAPSEDDFNSWIHTTAPNLPTDPEERTIGFIIVNLLPYIFQAAGFAVLLFVVLGGFQILISQGDPKRIAAGREKITYALVGMVVLFAAYWIVRLMANILDIEQLKLIFGSS